MPAQGYIKGPRVTSKDLAKLFYQHGWRDKELITAVAVCLSESGGYMNAYNDNLDDAGKILSRDVGLMQINIPGEKVGTKFEKDLFLKDNNIKAAKSLYDRRGWQPWVAYNRGIALDPSWWRWSEKNQEIAPAGRRIHRAIKGVANFYAEEFEIASKRGTFVDFFWIPPKPPSKEELL